MSKTVENIKELHSLTASILNDVDTLNKIDKIVLEITQAYVKGKKVLFCGNGGSASEAQHLAAELSGKFKLNRKPIPAEACHVNTSFVTAVSNDYNFNKVYSRYIEGFGTEGDILVALSTSGKSANILLALETAKMKQMKTVGFTGDDASEMEKLCDELIAVPSANVPRIQEIHLLLGHIICELVEYELFGRNE